MKRCETCGKPFPDEKLVMKNGREECSECAIKNFQLRNQGKPLLPKVYTNNDDNLKKDNSAGLSFNFASTVLKILAIIKLIANLVGSIFAGVAIDYYYSGAAVVVAIVLILISLVLFAMEFLFLQMASDISVIRRITVRNYKESRE